jgi:hypothetical protein
MIKFVQCIRRRVELSPLEFHRSWDEYRQAVDAVAKATQAVRVTASRTLAVPQNTLVMVARGTEKPFDGVIEVWWERGGDVIDELDQPTVRSHVDAMRELQSQFMDLKHSSFFFTTEDVLFERKE